MSEDKIEKIEKMIMKELSRNSLIELLDYWDLQLCDLEQFFDLVKNSAELNAGKTKWHDLRENPNDLPKQDERFSTNISITVMNQNSEFAFYSFDDKKWYFQGKVRDVIAWCEIPKFKEF